MASNTAASENKRKRNHKNMGRKRKNRLANQGTTPSKAAFFAGTKKK